jgi:hypothetical protein
MAEPAPPRTNPALSELAVLVGEWQTELSNASFLSDQSATLRGHTSIKWIEQGAFLAMRQGQTPSGPPDGVWVIGRDQTQAEYEVLYFDVRPMSRVYHMSFAGSMWTMWRHAPGFWQKFECSIGTDQRKMTGHWEKSTDDGSTWDHDFDISYARE